MHTHRYHQHPYQLQAPARTFLCVQLILFSLLYFALPIQGQITDKDALDFSKLKDWNDYRTCVRNCFEWETGCSWDGCTPGRIRDGTGCETNKCLCGEQTVFNKGIEYIATCTEYACDDEPGVISGKKLLTDYCAMKGYNIGYTQVGGSSTVKGATVTVSVFATATVTVKVSQVTVELDPVTVTLDPVTVTASDLVTVTSEPKGGSSSEGGGIVGVQVGKWEKIAMAGLTALLGLM